MRAIVGDDPVQSKIAKAELAAATLIALTAPTLCELVWVLERGYKLSPAEVSSAIRRLIDSDTVEVDRPAAEAGLVLLDAGGDFADGVIAHEGRSLGGDIFVSFDRKAVQLVIGQGDSARSPA